MEKLQKKASEHLSNDPKMKKLLDKYGILGWGQPEDPFVELIYSIVNQQLSDKAASTIYERMVKTLKVNEPTPESILKAKKDKLRESGLSFSKIEYMKGLAKAVAEEELVLMELEKLENEKVIAELTKIKGIGRWTAEMFLMFTLRRPDIFSIGDLGLRTAVSNIYGVERENKKKIEKISLRWKPYRTFASRYLWKSLGE